jgi:hypothetical protein
MKQFSIQKSLSKKFVESLLTAGNEKIENAIYILRQRDAESINGYIEDGNKILFINWIRTEVCKYFGLLPKQLEQTSFRQITDAVNAFCNVCGHFEISPYMIASVTKRDRTSVLSYQKQYVESKEIGINKEYTQPIDELIQKIQSRVDAYQKFEESWTN